MTKIINFFRNGGKKEVFLEIEEITLFLKDNLKKGTKTVIFFQDSRYEYLFEQMACNIGGVTREEIGGVLNKTTVFLDLNIYLDSLDCSIFEGLRTFVFLCPKDISLVLITSSEFAYVPGENHDSLCESVKKFSPPDTFFIRREGAGPKPRLIKLNHYLMGKKWVYLKLLFDTLGITKK